MREQYRCSRGRRWLMVSRNARYRASNFPASSSMCTSFLLVRLPFARRNQAAQAVVDVKLPCARTATVAFEGGNKACVRKAEFGLVRLPFDLEDNVRAVPLGLFLDKVDVAVHDVPDDSLAWLPFSNPLSGVMDVLVAVLELSTETVG